MRRTGAGVQHSTHLCRSTTKLVSLLVCCILTGWNIFNSLVHSKHQHNTEQGPLQYRIKTTGIKILQRWASLPRLKRSQIFYWNETAMVSSSEYILSVQRRSVPSSVTSELYSCLRLRHNLNKHTHSVNYITTFILLPCTWIQICLTGSHRLFVRVGQITRRFRNLTTTGKKHNSTSNREESLWLYMLRNTLLMYCGPLVVERGMCATALDKL